MACYHYSLGVQESEPIIEDWGDYAEEYEGMVTTVKMRFLKLHDGKLAAAKNTTPAAVGVEVVSKIDCCYVHLGQVVTNNEGPASDVRDCLKEMGVPEACHARIIAELMEYIIEQVILEGHYESETVVLDIVETTGVVEQSVLEEILKRSESKEVVECERRWYVMDMGVDESWAWPEEAKGDIEYAVDVLRRQIEASRMAKCSEGRGGESVTRGAHGADGAGGHL